MHESSVAPITASKCAFVSRQSPRYTYGGSTIRPPHPTAAARLRELDALRGAQPAIAGDHRARVADRAPAGFENPHFLIEVQRRRLTQ